MSKIDPSAWGKRILEKVKGGEEGPKPATVATAAAVATAVTAAAFVGGVQATAEVVNTASNQVIPHGDTGLFGQTANQARKAKIDPADIPDLRKAPPSFVVDGKRVVFMDIAKTEATLAIDMKGKQAKVHATVNATQAEAGAPVLDLAVEDEDILSVTVDGKKVDPKLYKTVLAPLGETETRILDQRLEPGKHTIEIEYRLKNGFEFDKGTVSWLTAMNDTPTHPAREFLEQYFPSNFEFDRHPMSLRITGVPEGHRVLANGAVKKQADGSYAITFPAHYTASSQFVHVLNPKEFTFKEETIKLKSGSTRVTVYSQSKHQAAEGLATIREMIAWFEKTLGAFPNKELIAFVNTDMEDGDGMEHTGATITSVDALPHEIIHMGPGRGFEPVNGNSGSVDEAFTTYLDEHVRTGEGRRAKAIDMEKDFPNLLAYSPYRRDTTAHAYESGVEALQELDLLLKDRGGALPVIRGFYAKYKNQTITTENFIQFIRPLLPKEFESAEGSTYSGDAWIVSRFYAGNPEAAKAALG